MEKPTKGARRSRIGSLTSKSPTSPTVTITDKTRITCCANPFAHETIPVIEPAGESKPLRNHLRSGRALPLPEWSTDEISFQPYPRSADRGGMLRWRAAPNDRRRDLDSGERGGRRRPGRGRDDPRRRRSICPIRCLAGSHLHPVSNFIPSRAKVSSRLRVEFAKLPLAFVALPR